MKFSLISSAIIGASMTLAAPAPQQEANVVTEVQQYTTVVPATTVVGGSGPTNLPDSSIGSNGNIVQLDSNLNPVQDRNNTSDPFDSTEAGYQALGSNRVSGSRNPNQIGGSPGNAGAVLGSGTNDFETDVYDYSGYPGGFDRQAGQSEDGSYGPDSGPAEGSVSINSADAGAITGTNSNSPPISSSIFFRLVANVTGNEDPYGINGYYVGTYHVSSASSIAHLTSNSGGSGGSSAGSGNGSGSGGVGRVFHTNGTAEAIREHLGTTVTSGGTSPFPESIVLTDGLNTTNVGASNIANVYINAGLGTEGVEVELNDNGVYVLSGAGDAGYYACYNQNVPYDSTHTLKYLRDGEEVPSECTAIVLIPECSDGDGNPYTTGDRNANQQNEIGCYINVSEINWSQYS